MSIFKYIDKYTIWIFLILFISDDTVLFGPNANNIFVSFKYAFIIFAFFYFFVKATKQKIGVESLRWLSVMSALILLSAVFSHDFSFGYIYKIVLLCTGLFFTKVVDVHGFMTRYINVMFFISVYAVSFHILGLINHSIIEIFPTVVNSANVHFYNLFISTWPNYSDIIRLFGPFREPGVYQMFVNLALLFCFVVEKELDIKKIFVFVVAIILTYSTTGYIVMAFILVFLVTLNKKKTKFQRRQLYLIEGLVVIGILYLAIYTDLLTSEGIIFDKFENTQRSTTVSRIGSIVCNVQIFLQDPIFGVGLNELEKLFPLFCFRTYGVESYHNTNILLVQFAAHGFLYGLLWSSMILKFFVNFANSTTGKVCLILACLSFCCGENLSWSIIIYILLFYGINKDDYFRQQFYIKRFEA